MISGRKDNKISSIKIIKYWVEVDESVSAESRHPTQPILPESARAHTHTCSSISTRQDAQAFLHCGTLNISLSSFLTL